MLTLGKHIILDLINVNPHYLRKGNYGLSVLREAAIRSGSNIISEGKKYFPNGGYTVILGLEESHISIHTWPEHQYAAVDIFMCGSTDIEAARDTIIRAFNPESKTSKTILRGIPQDYSSVSSWGMYPTSEGTPL